VRDKGYRGVARGTARTLGNRLAQQKVWQDRRKAAEKGGFNQRDFRFKRRQSLAASGIWLRNQ
jgi:hypothetical protein